MNRRFIDKIQTGINSVAATVAIANCIPIEVKNAKRITFYFERTDHTTGSSDFEVFGSIDGVNYNVLPLVTVAANTNGQNLTRVVKVSLASATSAIAFLEELFCGFNWIKIVPTITTDGKSIAKVMIDDELTS